LNVVCEYDQGILDDSEKFEIEEVEGKCVAELKVTVFYPAS
jgi:hypothetical protein